MTERNYSTNQLLDWSKNKQKN